MRTGIVIGIHGTETAGTAPRWEELRDQVVAAEQVGFDIAVLEDALYFGRSGMWEAMTIAGAVAAVTSSIGIAHSVVNAPARPAAMIAKAAETLDEISGGRYTLGIGAGNTPEDYVAFDIPADPRVSRFEESIAIVHGLLREGRIDFAGSYQSARNTKLYPRGPRRSGPPIVIAAGGPRMIRLCARYGDGWNWWGDATAPPTEFVPLIEQLERACEAEGRDPHSVQRSIDLYSYDPLHLTNSDRPRHVLGGSTTEMAESILALGDIGIDEVRLDVVVPPADRVAAVSAMADLVEAVHRG